jgi:peptidoglycan/xylan/chitin deacetylase (PgdA/CDA1 family)
MGRLFYFIKPLIPRFLQIAIRRQIVLRKRRIYRNVWPIDKSAGRSPQNWQGWPDGNQFALILTHDVDTKRGHDKCWQLMEVERYLGFRSSFNFVPERYSVSKELRENLCENGFEVGLHGLKHDGKLYSSMKQFKKRAVKINQYLKEWGSVGFRSPSMHHNLNWIHELDIEYDASTFDTDPFEPQSDGVNKIFPFWVKGNGGQRGYVELPYTLPQDFTLFVLVKERNIDIWKKKLDWIAQKGGMALINTHPDYMNFNENEISMEEYPVQLYTDFLDYITSAYHGKFWHVLPKNLARFWQLRK